MELYYSSTNKLGGYFVPSPKSNSFTGMNDLFNYVDYNNDGILKSGDSHQAWTAEVMNGAVEFNAYAAGDDKDAFTCDGSCPKKILSLGTNPAPVPVYTYKSHNYDGNSGNSSWENRTIWLNGISVEILGENIDGNGAIKVKVRFDDYEVNNDVRWCGNIVLNPNYQNQDLSHYALNLMPGKTILLDRGKSPTQHVGVKDAGNNYILDSDSRKLFTQPTQFTVLANALFHTEENSTITVDNGSTFTVQSGGRLELHGQMLIKNGSKIVIEDGAEIFLHRGAKLLIQSGGTLEYKNNTTSKGIIFGTQPSGYSEPYMEITGNLTVAPNTTFTFTGNGYINWKSGNSSTFGANAKFKLNGSGKADLVMKFENNAIVNMSPSEIEIKNGKIEYQSNSSFNANNAATLFQNVRFAGWSNNIGFKGNSLSSFTMNNNSEVNDFINNGIGIWLQALPKTATINVSNSSFTNCATALKGENLDLANFNTVIVQNSNTGYHFINTRVVNANANELVNCYTAVELNEVRGFYLNGGKIHDNNTAATIWGIHASNSLVFMRNGAMIDLSNVGIDITGSAPTFNSNSYKSMVTIGDQGCGAIINCSTAIIGQNTLMNIDAVQHAINRGTPSDIRPNRFDGNNKVLELCYIPAIVSLGTPPQPNVINAKGNFWKHSAGNPATWHGIDAIPTMFDVKIKYGGVNCSKPICVDTRCFSEILLSQLIQNGCMNNPMTSCNPTAQSCPSGKGKGGMAPPGNGGGSGGGMIEKCPIDFKIPDKTIDEHFKEANIAFLPEDKEESRLSFKNIAELELKQDPSGDMVVCKIDDPSCGNGGGGGNLGEKISNPCAQLVMVSKVLYEGAAPMQLRLANPENTQVEIAEHETLPSHISHLTSHVSIYPNPNDGTMTIAYSLPEGENGKFVIFDVTGRKISEYKLSSENQNFTVAESKLATGIFYYQFTVDDNPIKTGKLIVLK